MLTLQLLGFILLAVQIKLPIMSLIIILRYKLSSIKKKRLLVWKLIAKTLLLIVWLMYVGSKKMASKLEQLDNLCNQYCFLL